MLVTFHGLISSLRVADGSAVFLCRVVYVFPGSQVRIETGAKWFVLESGSFPTGLSSASKSSHESGSKSALDVPSMNTVNAFLDKYGRFGLDAATATSTIGFAAAKATTKLGVRHVNSSSFPALTPRLSVVWCHPQSSIDRSRCHGLSSRLCCRRTPRR